MRFDFVFSKCGSNNMVCDVLPDVYVLFPGYLLRCLLISLHSVGIVPPPKFH